MRRLELTQIRDIPLFSVTTLSKCNSNPTCWIPFRDESDKQSNVGKNNIQFNRMTPLRHVYIIANGVSIDLIRRKQVESINSLR